MIDEGYIKYQCNWLKSIAISREIFVKLNPWRDKLYQLGLIGEYENGIGFGNLSIRNPKNPQQFIITGTHTGSLATLSEQHYTTVTDFNWQENWVTCCGSIQASSEALTHGAIYVADPEINAVIHVHHGELWRKLMDKVPTTHRNCAYGTPEMAQEIIRLCKNNQLKNTKIIVMSGHEEGIISFGKNLDEAGEILLNYYS